MANTVKRTHQQGHDGGPVADEKENAEADIRKQRKLDNMPDFQKIHEAWTQKQGKLKQASKKPLTTPAEFALSTSNKRAVPMPTSSDTKKPQAQNEPLVRLDVTPKESIPAAQVARPALPPPTLSEPLPRPSPSADGMNRSRFVLPATPAEQKSKPQSPEESPSEVFPSFSEAPRPPTPKTIPMSPALVARATATPRLHGTHVSFDLVAPPPESPLSRSVPSSPLAQSLPLTSPLRAAPSPYLHRPTPSMPGHTERFEVDQQSRQMILGTIDPKDDSSFRRTTYGSAASRLALNGASAIGRMSATRSELEPDQRRLSLIPGLEGPPRRVATATAGAAAAPAWTPRSLKTMAETLRELYREHPQALTAQRPSAPLVPGSPMRVPASPSKQPQPQQPAQVAPPPQSLPIYQLQPGIPPQLQLTPQQQQQYSYYIPQQQFAAVPHLTYQPRY